MVVRSGDRSNTLFVSDGPLTPKTGVVVTAVVFQNQRVFLEVAAIRAHMVAAIADAAVCALVHEGAVGLVLLPERLKRNLIH